MHGRSVEHFGHCLVHVLSAIFEASYRHMRAVSGPGRKA